MVYDGLLMLGLAFIAAAPVVVASGGDQVAGEPAFRLYLAAVIAAYFIASWCRGGQTVGKRLVGLRADERGGEIVTRSKSGRALRAQFDYEGHLTLLEAI